jgi:hypothetical protein
MRAVELRLPEDERHIVNVAFNRQSLPFALGVTDHAVYTPELNRWSLTESWKPTARRVPLEHIKRVTVRRTRIGRVVLVSLILALYGGVATFSMFLASSGGRAEISPWPVIVVFVALILPFVVRRRRSLRIDFVDGKPCIWKPPIFVSQMTRQHINYLMDQIIKGFRSQRIYVSEE